MVQRNPLYDFGDEGEDEAPTFNEKWGSLPVEAPRFNLTPNVALVESEPKSLKQGTDPVTGRPDLKFVPVDDPWANTPKPIKRLLGVGGEERYQLWPERALRSGLSAPLDALTGKMQVNDPETGMPTDEAIRRSQDVASVGGPGGLMNLEEKGVLGSHGGNLVQPTPKVAAPFYSAVEHAVSNIKQDKMPADQWLGTLTNSKGVKPEELDWTGLKDHLVERGKEPVTKQEVQDYVNANKVELKEVTGGNLKPEPIIGINGKTTGEWRVPNTENRFKTREEAESWAKTNGIPGDLPASPMRSTITQYQLPGGENYKEMLMTLPDKNPITHTTENVKLAPEEAAQRSTRDQELFHFIRGPDNVYQISKSKFPNAQDAINYVINEKKPSPSLNQYKSSHWDEPNILAHVRTNDRNITAPGETTPKKSLHIEEIQSDWHQAGREKGYKGSIPTDAEVKKFFDLKDAANPADYRQEMMEHRDFNSNLVPDAPFKKTWHELALKRMIREAAEKGYDRLSWTPGEAQAARYSLEKQVDKIATKKNANGNYDVEIWPKGAGTSFKEEKSAKQLSDFVGKEMADKIIQKHETMGPSGVQWEGERLKVGGEGMKGFYDKMIPNAIEKIGKEHGVKVKQAEEKTPTFSAYDGEDKISPEFKSAAEARMWAKENSKGKSVRQNEGSDQPKVHYIDIPESLKSQALGKGFPLFSSGGHLLNPIPGNPHEQVDNSHHVPYGAGASNTPSGFPVNIDKRIPKYDDKLKLPNGQPADLHKYLTIHEIEEYKAMKAGIPYHKAHHEIATPMEKKAVESDGVSWSEYEHVMDGYLKETEEGGFKNLPPRLYTKPYPHSRSLKMDHGEDNGKDN